MSIIDRSIIPVAENQNTRPFFISDVPEPVLPSSQEIQSPSTKNSGIQGFGDKIKSLVDPIFDNEIYRNWIGTNSELTQSINDLRTGFSKTITDVKSLMDDPRYGIFRLAHNNQAKPPAKEVKNDHIKKGKLSDPDLVTGSSSTIEPGSLEPAEPLNLDDRNIDKYVEMIEEAGLSPYVVHAANEARLRREADEILKAYDFTDVTYDNYLVDGTQATSVQGYTQVPLSYQGYKSLNGMTLANDALWDLRLRLPEVLDKLPDSFLPHIPRQYREYQPITNYSYSEYSLKSKSIEGAVGIGIEIFDGINLGTSLDIGLVEDDGFTWTRYFDSVVKSMWSKKDNAVAPYKNCVFVGELMVYNSINRIYFRKKLLLVLTSFNKNLSGAESSGLIELQLGFSIVGDLNGRHRIV